MASRGLTAGAQTTGARGGRGGAQGRKQAKGAGRAARTAVAHRRTPRGTNSDGALAHTHGQRWCTCAHRAARQRWRTDAHRAAQTAAVHRRTPGGLDSGGALAHTGAGGQTALAHRRTPGGTHGALGPWHTHQGGTHSGGAHVHGRQLTSRAVVPYAAGCPALCREQVAVTQAALVTVVVRDAVGRAPLALAAAGAHRRQRQKHLAPVAIFGRLGNSQGDSPDPDTVSGHSGAGMPIPGGISHRGRQLRWAERTQNGPCQGLSRRSGVISVPERVFSCFGQPKWARNGP